MATLESSADRIETIEEGKLATLTANYLFEPVQEAREKAIKKLISCYRAEKTHHDILVGIAAELSALDALMSGLESTQLRAEVAANKEYRHG